MARRRRREEWSEQALIDRYIALEMQREAVVEFESDRTVRAEEKFFVLSDQYETAKDTWQRLEDRADTRRSRAWRTRDLRESQAWYEESTRLRVLVEKAEEAVDVARLSDRQYRERRLAAIDDEMFDIRERLEPTRHQYEYVLRVTYRSRRSGHGADWDIRLRKGDGTQATAPEMSQVIRALKYHAEVPPDWSGFTLSWRRRGRESALDPSEGEYGQALEGFRNVLSGAGVNIDWSQPIEIGEEER